MSKSYEFEVLPTHIHVVLKDEFDLRDDLEEYVRTITDNLDQAGKPLFLMVEMYNLSFGVDDLIFAASYSARGGGAFLHHKHIRETVIISDSKAIELAAKGLNNPIFGNLKTKVFATVDEALNYIQQHSR